MTQIPPNTDAIPNFDPPLTSSDTRALSHANIDEHADDINNEDSNASGRRNSTAANKKPDKRTLTKAQQDKKRANDREAQRAIRERTRKQIENLEQRIRDLESGEAYRQLQDALKQKEAVENENVDLKRSLAQVLDIVRPLASILGASNNHQAPGGQYPVPTYTPDPRANTSSTEARSERYSQRPNHFDLNLNQQQQPNAPSNGSVDAYRRHLAMGAPWERSKQDPPSPYIHAPTSSHPSTTPNPFFTPEDTTDRTQKRQRTSYDNPSPHPPTPTYHHQKPPPLDPRTTHLPLNIAPTCRLDTILTDFTTSARRRLNAGTPLPDVLGPPYPVFNSMLDPSAPMPHHPTSELLAEVLKGFSAISGAPEKIAVIAHMFVILRWYIAPSPETYAAIPSWALPTEEQLRVAHPVWIDYLPFPRMRAKMVYHYPLLPLDNFFYPYTTTLSVGFENGDLGACLYRDGNGDMRVTPEFEAHWRDGGNYSLGVYFAQQLPALGDACAVRGGEVGGKEGVE